MAIVLLDLSVVKSIAISPPDNTRRTSEQKIKKSFRDFSRNFLASSFVIINKEV